MNTPSQSNGGFTYMDLEEFAKSETKGGGRRRCHTCALKPEVLEQIHAGRQRTPKPVPFPTISKWLEEEHGVKIQQNTIRNHFVAGHHND